jgi:hypothetical protein
VLEIELRRALRTWQARQRTDGYVEAMAVILSAFPVLHFLVSPDRPTVWVMGLFLLILTIACLRLLRSAAKVAAIRTTLCPKIVPEVIEAEVIDSVDRQG